MPKSVRTPKVSVGYKYGFRSGLEEKIAAQLEGNATPFRYEAKSDVIKYEWPAKVSRYTPDFVLTKSDGTPLIIETKGRFVTKDRQKHLLIQQQYPELDIRFVFSNSNNRISKTSRTTYAMWCEKNGFLYADKVVPAAWLKE